MVTDLRETFEGEYIPPKKSVRKILGAKAARFIQKREGISLEPLETLTGENAREKRAFLHNRLATLKREWEETGDNSFVPEMRSILAELNATIEEPEIPVAEEVSLIQRVYPEFTSVEEAITSLETQALEDPDAFLDDIASRGRNEDTENLLRALELSEEEIDAAFTYRDIPEEGSDYVYRTGDIDPVTGAEFRTMGTIKPNGVVYDGDRWVGMVNINTGEFFTAKEIKRLSMPSDEEQRQMMQNKGIDPEEIEKIIAQSHLDMSTEEWLQEYRKINPSTWKTIGLSTISRSAVAGIGGAIRGTGGTAAWAKQETLSKNLIELGDFLGSLGPPMVPYTTFGETVLNPDFWATSGVQMISSSVTMMLPLIVATCAAVPVAGAIGLGATATSIFAVVTGSTIGALGESALESGAAYNEAIDMGKSPEEASKIAGSVYWQNAALLTGSNLLELGAIFTGNGPAIFQSLLNKGLVKGVIVGGKIVGGGLTESGQELSQNLITNKAFGRETKWDDEAKMTVLISFMMGGAFVGAGTLFTKIQDRTIDKFTPEQKQVFDGISEELVLQGLVREGAKLRALDYMVDNDTDAKAKLEETIKEVDKEEALKQVKPTDEVEAAAFEHIKKQEGVIAPVEEIPTIEPEVAPVEPVVTPEEVTPAPEVTPPVTEAGMPEAGIQEAAFGVPAREVRPKGKGRVVQISMEDQLKLEQARQAAEEAPADVQDAYYAQAEIEGLKATHEGDPVATYRFKMGNRNVGLDSLISIREQIFPDYVTLKQAQALNPGKAFERYTQKGTPQYNRVPIADAFDELTKEFNMTPDEIADRVMAIRREKQLIKEHEATIKRQMTEKPSEVLPEPTPEEIALTPTGEKVLTAAQRVRTLALFGKYVMSESTLDAFELTRELRRETRSGQAENLKARAQELIVEQGMPAEQAMKQAIQETLSGELPVITTDYMDDLTNQMRDVLFREVSVKMKEYPFEMASTYTALLNALPLRDAQGKLIRSAKAIPREKGTGSILFPQGGSAWDRLNYVFGEHPEVMKALDTIAKEGKTIRDVVEGIYHETGREPIPIDQEMAEYLRSLATWSMQEAEALHIPTEARGKLTYAPTGELGLTQEGQQILLGEKPYQALNVSDLRSPADLQFAKSDLELARELAEGKITFDEFQLARTEARDRAYPPTVPLKFDPPIDNAFKQPPMFSFMEQSMLNRVLKELLWSPLDIGNFLRANKASFDNSFLRQSKALAGGHPVVGFQAHTTAWQSMFSQKHTEAEWELITRDPDFQIYDQIRQDTGHDPLRVPAFAGVKGTERWRTAEEFGFPTVERLIPRLTQKLPHIKYFERAFSAGTNKIVWGVWKQKLEWSRRYSEKIASGEITLKEGEAFDIIQEMTDHQAMLGDMIQRANLRRFSGLAPAMNAFFFAARSKIGRFLAPTHLIGVTIRQGKVNFNPRIIKEAWRDFLLTNAEIAGVMFLGSWLGLWDLEDDPRNAEFMSARIGNTRIDPWAGQRQFVVLYTRLVTKTGVSSVTGAEYDVNPQGALTSFITNSLSPLASAMLEFYTGRNFIGGVIDFKDAKYWIEKITPFAINDVWEAAEEDWRIGVAVTIPAIYGEGVQTYTGDWEENFTKLGLPKYLENTGYGITKPPYDTADFWADTASQFTGVDPTTLTAEKGFPEYIRAIVNAKIIKEHLSTLPSEKLISLNADPNLDEPTFTEYRQMWTDRQKLVAAGDKAEWTDDELQPGGKYKEVTYKGEDALTAFDKKYTKANLGNFSQRQFALLMEYHSITDKTKQAEFLKLHKDEIGIKPRDEYLRTHPKENAQLAVWGQVSIYSKEAYNEFKSLIKSLDIPDNAIPEFTLPPEGSIDSHFSYEDVVSEYGGGSLQADLILAQDDAYREWRGLQPIASSVEALELKISNKDLDENSQEYKDNTRKIEAYDNNGTDFVDSWVDRGHKIDEFGAGSSEAKAWLLDNPEVHQWAIDNKLLTDDGSDWNEEVIRLNVELGGLEEGSEQYSIVKRKIQAHSEGFTRIDDFVAYYDLPVAGFKQKRYLIENPEFAAEMKDIKGIEPPDYIPPVEYDELLEKETRTPEEELKVKAYDKKVPLEHIDNYVAFYSITKPEDYPDMPFYEDDFFLIENPTFYKEVYLGTLGNQRADFRLVPPTRKLLDKWIAYNRIKFNQAKRDQFRLDNPDLDKWGVSVGIWAMTMTEKRRRAGRTAGEKTAEEVEEMIEEIEEIEEIPEVVPIR